MPAMDAPGSAIPQEVTPIKRSGGVTAIAVFSLLGSLLMLLMAAFMALLPFLSSKLASNDSPAPPGLAKTLLLMVALMYLALAIWGIATSFGLFRLRAWARISIMVFAVLLIISGGFTALMALIVPSVTPANPNLDPNAASAVGIFMFGFAAGIAGIGIWWLIYFTRARVKLQFMAVRTVAADGAAASLLPLAPSPPVRRKRPLSLTIIAWMLLAGCLFLPFNIALHYPAAFFLTVLTGWLAALYYLMFLPAHLFIGIGLLRFKPAARMVGIAYYIFLFLNMTVFYLFPGGQVRLLGLMRGSMFIWTRARPWPNDPLVLFNSKPLLLLAAFAALVGIAVPLYFLITRGQAFEAAAAARDRDVEPSIQTGSSAPQ
jgi:hypothetical protein